MTEAPTRSFPTLAESRRLRLVAFAALYVAQGIGVGPLLYALPPYFAQNGLTQATIGAYIGVVFLPWSLKLVAGPLMDRWSFLPMGRRRPWVLASQLGIVLSFLAVALVPEPLEKLSWLIAGCFMANVFIAFQDVAIDGMAVDILPHAEQGPANGLMFGGQALGIAGATAVSAWVLSASGPATMFFLLAGMFAVAMLVPLVARERPGERLLPWSPGGASGREGRARSRAARALMKPRRWVVLHSTTSRRPASMILRSSNHTVGCFTRPSR